MKVKVLVVDKLQANALRLVICFPTASTNGMQLVSCFFNQEINFGSSSSIKMNTLGPHMPENTHHLHWQHLALHIQ
jgi:hypothetical protein